MHLGKTGTAKMGSDVAKQEAVMSEEVEPQAKDVVRWKRLLLAI
jgi:hypothetical protein